MAKVKASKGAVGVPNKALHSRVSFLYQAAAYLVTQEPQALESSSNAERTDSHQAALKVLHKASQDDISLPSQALSRRCISDLRSVSLKAQIRLSPSMKHSICKRCNIMLLDSSTCASEIENKSKGGRKPWADVLVRRCKCCGYERRFPCEATRQMEGELARRSLETQQPKYTSCSFDGRKQPVLFVEASAQLLMMSAAIGAVD